MQFSQGFKAFFKKKINLAGKFFFFQYIKQGSIAEILLQVCCYRIIDCKDICNRKIFFPEMIREIDEVSFSLMLAP
jgi:hypothetical protein